MLSSEFSVKRLCRVADVSRSGFYKWRRRLTEPSPRALRFASDVALFTEYHGKYPSHGYRWLNRKIRLDTQRVMSDPYAHKCCRAAGIKSSAKRCRYRKPGRRYRTYPNMLLADLWIDAPYQCIVSDMTAFRFDGHYYELTLFLDIWNNEIVAHRLTSRRGDRMQYLDGLADLKELWSRQPGGQMILHSDQGTVYASKEFNEGLEKLRILRSMSRAGTPTDNAVIEAINGWIKAELLTDLHITGKRPIAEEIADYVRFFNEERPSYALEYLTPKQFKELHGGRSGQGAAARRLHKHDRRESKSPVCIGNGT